MSIQGGNIFSVLDSKSITPEKMNTLNIILWEKLVIQMLIFPDTNVINCNQRSARYNVDGALCQPAPFLPAVAGSASDQDAPPADRAASVAADDQTPGYRTFIRAYAPSTTIKDP